MAMTGERYAGDGVERPGIRVTYEKAAEAGGCTFCARDVQHVYVVASNAPRLSTSVRFCATCMATIRREAAFAR